MFETITQQVVAAAQERAAASPEYGTSGAVGTRRLGGSPVIYVNVMIPG
jgi:hypothetical protein